MIRPNGNRFAVAPPTADERQDLEAAVAGLLTGLAATGDDKAPQIAVMLANLSIAGLAEAARRGVPIGLALRSLSEHLMPDFMAGKVAEQNNVTPPPASWAALVATQLCDLAAVLGSATPHEASKLTTILGKLDRAGLLAIAAAAHNIAVDACTCGPRAATCPTCQARDVRDQIARAQGKIVGVNGRPLS